MKPLKSGVITLTHIDTGGHGYLSVSKELIRQLGLVKRISQYSGLTFTRVYLEEDCDAPLFLDALKAAGLAYKIKSGYNPKFAIHHGYSPALFDYEPRLGDMVICGDLPYKVVKIAKRITIESILLGRFSIPYTNPFKYIQAYYREEGIEKLRTGLAKVGIERDTDQLVNSWHLTGDEPLNEVVDSYKDYMSEYDSL